MNIYKELAYQYVACMLQYAGDHKEILCEIVDLASGLIDDSDAKDTLLIAERMLNALEYKISEKYNPVVSGDMAGMHAMFGMIINAIHSFILMMRDNKYSTIAMIIIRDSFITARTEFYHNPLIRRREE